MTTIELDRKKLRLPHGEKGNIPCVSVSLHPDTVARIDAVIPRLYRSAYVERAARLMLALQTGEGIDKWAEWFVNAAMPSLLWDRLEFLARALEAEDVEQVRAEMIHEGAWPSL